MSADPIWKDAETVCSIYTELDRTFVSQWNLEVEKGRLTIPQYYCLNMLDLGPMNMSQLAKRMGHTTAATTGLIDRLVEAGLVDRKPVPADRRQVLLSLTERGHDTVTKVRKDFIKVIASIMEKLKPSDRRDWVRVYQRVREVCRDCKP